jgi:hypothetical protein
VALPAPFPKDSKDPKEFRFDLDWFSAPDQESYRDELAKRICRQIEEGLAAKGQLPDRWRANEATYACTAPPANLDIIEGFTGEQLPIWQSKCDRIAGSVYSSITSLYPMVQCIDKAAGATNIEDLELFMQNLASDAGYTSRNLKPCIHDALNTNAGIMRVMPETDEDGHVVGIKIDSFSPLDVVAYPSQCAESKNQVLIGHRLDRMVWEINEMIDSGEYLDPPKPVTGYDPRKRTDDIDDEEDEGDEEMGVDTEPVDPEEANVELYEVIAKIRMEGDSKRRWYLLTIWYEGQVILRIQPYGAEFPSPSDGEEPEFKWYPEPWYVKHSVKYDRDAYWSPWSPANAMQTIQNRVCENIEIAQQGSIFGAFNTTFITEGGMKSKEMRPKPGYIYELPADAKVQSISNQFNPGLLMPVTEFLGETADASTGVSRLGTSQEIPASTSATAAQGFLQAQAKAENDYTDAISLAVEQTWNIMFWIIKIHASTIIAANKDSCPETLTAEKLKALNLRMKVTGSDGSSTPQTIIQKLMFAKQITMNNPAYDQSKIDEKILDALDLPFTVSSLLKGLPQLSQQVINLLYAQGVTPENLQGAMAIYFQQEQAKMQAQQQLQQAQAMHAQGVSDTAPNGQPNGQPPAAGAPQPSQPPGNQQPLPQPGVGGGGPLPPPGAPGQA